MNCKKVVVRGVKDVVVEDFSIDENNITPEQCIIENYTTYISPGTELSRVFGLKKGASYPMQPGYSAVGKVIKKGAKVTEVDEGDVVFHTGPHASHHIFDYSSYGDGLYKLTKSITYEEASLLSMCHIATNGILPVDVKLGDTCIIMGLGTLGLILSVYYKQMGIKVIAVDPAKKRCEQAKSMGIETVLDCAPDEQLGKLMELTNNKGADIVIEATGLAACIGTCVAVAAPLGTVVLLGSPRTDYETNITPIFNAIHMKMLNVVGALCSRYNFEKTRGTRMSIIRNFGIIEDLMSKKILDADKLISHRIYPTDEELMAAYDGLMNNKNEYTGVVINWKEGK